MRISVTARSSSVWDTLCTGDLGVDEHVLDLLRASGEPIAGTPGPYLKAWELRGDPPLAPADLALERHRRALEPDALVLAHRGEAPAEVEPLRACGGCEQLVQRGRLSFRESEQVAIRGRMEGTQARQDLVSDQTALRVAVRGIDPEFEPFLAAVRLGLLSPHSQERTHDAVLAPRPDSLRCTARDEPVQHCLDLVRGDRKSTRLNSSH